jgi:tetratricopeptide (TPR) repeat protein
MSSKAADETFRKAMQTLDKNGLNKEALALFEAAVTLDARSTGNRGRPRYRSYYGMCLALEGNKFRDGLALCRSAAQEEFYSADLWMNLGKVEMEFGNRDEAHEAFLRGFRLAPHERGFLDQLEILGRRRPPLISFLSRRNPLNVMFGRLTHKLSRKADDQS